MNKDQFLSSGLLEQYVLGLTTEEESMVVEDFASQYKEVQQELSLLREAMDHYAAQSAPSVQMASTGEMGKATQKRSDLGLRKLNSRALWPLAAAFALIWGIYGALKNDIHHQQIREWKEKYALLSKDCHIKGQSNQELADLSFFLQHRHTSKVILSGCSMSEGSFAIAFWNPAAKKGYIDMCSLPIPPKGKTYQLWADVHGKMISAGTLPYATGELQPIHFIENAVSLNITLEPEGGSRQPTVSFLQANGMLAVN